MQILLHGGAVKKNIIKPFDLPCLVTDLENLNTRTSNEITSSQYSIVIKIKNKPQNATLLQLFDDGCVLNLGIKRNKIIINNIETKEIKEENKLIVVLVNEENIDIYVNKVPVLINSKIKAIKGIKEIVLGKRKNGTEKLKGNILEFYLYKFCMSFLQKNLIENYLV